MPPEPIRVGIDISCLLARPFTGVGHYASYLLRAFLAQAKDFEVSLVANSMGAKAGELESFAPRCKSTRQLRFPTRIKNALWTGIEWPPIEWFTGPVDIAHGFFHLTPASAKAHRMVTVHGLTTILREDTHIRESTQIHRRLLSHAVRKADSFVTVSESCKNDLVGLMGVDPDSVHVVYGGVDHEEFTTPFDEDRFKELKSAFGIHRDYFIYLGTLETGKNIVRLLNAYARVREKYTDCPILLLVGKKGWKSEAIFETIEKRALSTSVVVTGYLPRNDAMVLLRGAYACLHPSLYEGFGLPVLEAMSARIPVLTSNVSSLPEVIGDTGIQVDPEDEAAIEHGIRQLLDHRDRALARANDAYTRAQRFSWSASADALAKVYRTLAE